MVLLKTILLSMILILVGAVLFAVSSKLVGREDKAHGCGLEGSCETCELRHRNQGDKTLPCPDPEDNTTHTETDRRKRSP